MLFDGLSTVFRSQLSPIIYLDIIAAGLMAMAQEMDSHLALSLSISSPLEKQDLGLGW